MLEKHLLFVGKRRFNPHPAAAKTTYTAVGRTHTYTYKVSRHPHCVDRMRFVPSRFSSETSIPRGWWTATFSISAARPLLLLACRAQHQLDVPIATLDRGPTTSLLRHVHHCRHLFYQNHCSSLLPPALRVDRHAGMVVLTQRTTLCGDILTRKFVVVNKVRRNSKPKNKFNPKRRFHWFSKVTALLRAIRGSRVILFSLERAQEHTTATQRYYLSAEYLYYDIISVWIATGTAQHTAPELPSPSSFKQQLRYSTARLRLS